MLYDTEMREEKANPQAAAFISRLITAVSGAHKLHLQATTYSKHVAMGALYEGLQGVADSLAEEYMGCYGFIASYPDDNTATGTDAIAYVQALCEYVCSQRVVMGDDSQIQNSIDAIVSLLNTTLYKLKVLA